MAYAYVSRHSVGRQVLGRAIRIHALDLDLDLALDLDLVWAIQFQDNAKSNPSPPAVHQ